MKSLKIPDNLGKGTSPLKITIKVGKQGFVRTEVLTSWEVGDDVWVDNEATEVILEKKSAKKQRVSIKF